tara:strand:- start:11 stop:376 length:366 start_codon:yes stop_codon:yes gene_type:complete
MSIIFLQHGVELLEFNPSEFRRVYTLNNDLSLEYSHSDSVVCLKNGERAMVEIVQGLLPAGQYVVKTSPTDLVFDFRLVAEGTDCMSQLKKIIFMANPDLPCGDFYCQKRIEPCLAKECSL